MPFQVFIDGQEGTTGLELQKRLQERSDIELLAVDPQLRKDVATKRAIYDHADLVVLCLPDEAAKEAVSLNSKARFLDASTAHRTHSEWVYGLPELNSNQRQAIADAQYVSNPGCYPTGFILSVRPLVDAGILSPNVLVRTHSVSGFSGGGKTLISKYEESGTHLNEARPYALGLKHKHVSEMQRYAGLTHAPLFEPMVAGFYRGMLVRTPLFASELNGYNNPETILSVYRERFEDEPFVEICNGNDETEANGGFLTALGCNESNRVELMAFGHEEQVSVTARLDNLGKGAAMAAIQNLNLMLGLPEQTGLSN